MRVTAPRFRKPDSPRNLRIAALAEARARGNKICSRCDRELPLSDFWRHGRGYGDGRQTYCKPCASVRNRKYWQETGKPPRFYSCAPPAGTCSSCKETKPDDEFYRRYDSRNQQSSRCVDCTTADNRSDRRKLAKRAAKYGLTVEEFRRLDTMQGGLCAVPRCGRPHEHIDHCHESGAVRGLACFLHNTSIGHLGDDAAGMAAPFLYLLRFEIGTNDIDDLLIAAEQHLRTAAKEWTQ